MSPRSPRLPSSSRRAARQLALSRRGLFASALGAVGASTLGAGLSQLDPGLAEIVASIAAQEATPTAGGDPLCEPGEWGTRAGGLLWGELIAGTDSSRQPGGLSYLGGGTVCPGGQQGFGSQVPAPTMVLYPGDRVKLTLRNRLAIPPIGDPTTNLHFHGLHISPIGSGDNIFLHIPTGKDFAYEFDIPEDHPTGLFWYHPHFHQNTLWQVNRGLAGAIIVAEPPDEPADVKARLIARGLRDPAPPPETTHLLVLQYLDPALAGAPGAPAQTLFVNGQYQPTIAIRDGEEQRWRILNASADTFITVRVVGHTLQRRAVDGNWIPDFGKQSPVDLLPLGPGERAEVSIVGILPADGSRECEIRALKLDDGGIQFTPFLDPNFDDSSPGPYDLLAKLDFADTTPTSTSPPAIPIEDQAGIQRAPRKPDPDREIRFSNPAIMSIDGKRFDEGRIDQTVELGATETWRIYNEVEGTGWHPFHLHVNDFDVLKTSLTEGELEPAFYQDTMPVPGATAGVPGSIDINTTFADFTGRTVYHCHFLQHEDLGMMAVVDVVQPVKIAGAGYSPATVTVSASPHVPTPMDMATPGGWMRVENAGTTVVWTNLGSAEHTVTADALAADGKPVFDSGVLAKGRSFAHTFDAPGAFDYHSRTNPEMKGTVIVEAVQTIDVLPDQFLPKEVEVAAGTTVVWTNRLPELETLLISGDDFAPDSLSTRYRFDTPACFTYSRLNAAGEPIWGKIIVKPVTWRSVSIGISDDGLDRSEIAIPAGSTVTWTNRSTHLCRVALTDAAFDSGDLDPERPFVPGRPLSPGQRFTHTFSHPDTYTYSITSTEVPGPAPEGTITVVPPVETVCDA